MDKFWNTQNTPTHKSATAKLARKKFVIDLSRRDIVTTRITNKLPGNGTKSKRMCQYQSDQEGVCLVVLSYLNVFLCAVVIYMYRILR